MKLIGRLFCLLMICLTPLPSAAAERINRSGYISISIDPILYESNLWETSHRISLDKFFTAKAADLGEALAEGLEKTAFRGQLRVIPGYKAEEQEKIRNAIAPDTFLIAVDIRSRYGLTEGSSAAACLSGISCFLLSPVKMFTYQTKSEATVTAFYFTPRGKRLRLVQQRYQTHGELSGNFYDAMDMSQELEWITRLTNETIDDLRRKILADLPTELVERSSRKAFDELAQQPEGSFATPGLPPKPELAETPAAQPGASPKQGRSTAEQKQELNLQELVRLVSPAIFKVRGDHGIGSGFVISTRGFGVTTLSLVNSGSVRIRFHSGKELTARVVQRNRELNLAVIRFESSDLTALAPGDPDSLKPGSRLLAIGYPEDFGLSITPTTLEDRLQVGGLPMLQTSNTFTTGNLGGALVDAHGEIVGVIVPAADGIAGTNRALAIDRVWRFAGAFAD